MFQIHKHCQAFSKGLADVVNIDWLRMFDHNELQVLISGAPVPIDIEDLRRHTNYGGRYFDKYIQQNVLLIVVGSLAICKKKISSFFQPPPPPPPPPTWGPDKSDSKNILMGYLNI